MAFHYSPKIVTDGLVLYLDAANTKSYNGGNTWYDISRNNISTQLINGPTFSSANYGNILFDGVDDYIVGTTSVFAFGTGEFALNYWFYVNSFSPFPSPTVLDCRTIGDDSGYADYVRSLDSTFRLYWNNAVRYISTTNVSSGRWYNVLVTRQDTTINVYIDGEFDGFIVDNTNFTASQLKLGRNVNQVGTSYLNGRVSSLLVYNRYLNSNEVLQNYNATKGRFGL